MREIKFRQFFSGNNSYPPKWHYFHVGGTNAAGEGWNQPQQYTGLCDRSEKEIFEGDIISVEKPEEEPFNGVVVFNPAEFLIKVKPGTVPHYPSIEYLPIYPGKGRVVGNVYENPELLESK